MAALLAAAGTQQSAADPETTPKREPPDYDGRGNPDQEAGSWVRWIPRVALSPIYAVNEFVLRRPLGALVTTAERRHWANAVVDIFTFGPGGRTMLVPTGLFDRGLKPSVGLYLASNDAFAKGNAIRIHATTWGPEWINVAATDRYTWNAGQTSLAARFEFKRQNDLLFFGTGPDVTDATRSRYGIQRIETGGTFRHKLSGESVVVASSGVRRIEYRDGDCCLDPSLDMRIADGTLAVPDGYDEPSYTTYYQRLELTLDTREPRPASSTGGYLKMQAETNFDVGNDRRWVEYGAIFGVAADLRSQRTLRAQVAVEYADPLDDSAVPFNELATLGGDNLMPGFLAGWIRGRSAIAAQLGYTWPVWSDLDGQLRLSVGNAFDGHLAGLAGNKLRLSADVGITTVGKRDHTFEILFGVGTETFEQGGDITSVRLSFGSRKGF